ncbi:alpha/beta hydrolase [Nocardia bovistercoris]|uniref:Alpha/beta hydrolase n=1 Tax=Nocardia bovistercoris TaxID=2785916 RepID=A0A931I8F7_9NOCA|nr:alpha/beta hydrolase [Nocardia bovistercoris]MBH0775293.1 alpha/beta hydrolase [Nocardia bovistercoris]
MNSDSRPSRDLLDPEIAAAIGAFPAFELGPSTIDAVRERLRSRMAAAPDGAQLFPAVDRTERKAPGLEDEPQVRVLYYAPRERTGPAPALVWHHGGGYVMGSADDDDLTCRRIALETGAVVVSVDYRLAPESPAPGPLNDSYAVLKWLHDNAAEFGLDPTRIAVGGTSAGGGIAAALAIRARDEGDLPVSFQLLIYPMLDDRTARGAAPHPQIGAAVWTPSDNLYGWTSYLGHEPGIDGVPAYAAPARVDDVTGLPPAFLCVGALDLFASEDIEYAKRLLEQGVPTELHVHPGGPHGYNIVPGSRLALVHARDFIDALNRHYRASAPERETAE